MFYSRSLAVLAALVPVALAAQAPTFEPAQVGALDTSTNYTGATNGTLATSPVVPGKVFDRFISIWLENTDFNDAATSTAFIQLKEQAILLDQYYALTHPSEPNYAASVGGDFWGMADDNFYHIPSNVSTIVDLLEAKNISWASYQENMPSDGFTGFNFSSANYLNSSAPPYTYYVRKHNPTVLYESVASVPSRLSRHRNFNDLAADVNASAIPQWLFITPNMLDDGHDTNIDYASDWLQFWLPTMLTDPNFNDNRTLILLTFDENENYAINNQVYTLLLGGAVPQSLWNTTDSTYYTHYSALSTVQANWGLGSLGRQDTNKTVSNVFSLVANVTGYQNVNVTDADRPLTNLTGTTPGPLNGNAYVPFLAPNPNATGAGGGAVFIASNVNMSLTPQSAPGPVNLTASNETVPSETSTPGVPAAPGPSNTSTGAGSGSGSGGSNGAAEMRVGAAMLVGLVGAVVALVL